MKPHAAFLDPTPPAAIGDASGLVAAILVALLTTGCSFLKPVPDTSRYFVLVSMQGSSAAAPARTSHDVHFGLGPVKLPGYLDTQRVVRTDNSGGMEYVPDAYWAEPVAGAFVRALLYRTGARIGTTHGVAFPWYSSTRVDWKVPVDVLRFEATADGRVVLVARWSVARATDGLVVAGAESVFEETAGSDPALIVDALSCCVDRLAEAIAEAVTSRAVGAAVKGASATAPAGAATNAASETAPAGAATKAASATAPAATSK
jgi:hypothetical protein